MIITAAPSCLARASRSDTERFGPVGPVFACGGRAFLWQGERSDRSARHAQTGRSRVARNGALGLRRSGRPRKQRTRFARPRARVGEGLRWPAQGRPWRRAFRSEEHTSELQSLMRISYAVFCLKKKKNKMKVM